MQKTVLITGCSSGFGRMLVTRFLEEGWIVCASMRNLAGRSKVFEGEMHRFPNKLHLFELDVTKREDIASIRTRLEEKISRLDCLINNAGVGSFGSGEETEEEVLRTVFETNFFGTIQVTRALLPWLRLHKGHIITVSSVFGVTGFPLTSSYCASKFAIEGYFESLRQEVLPFGVKVALVEPGGHRTGFMDHALWTRASLDPSSPYYKMAKGYQSIQERLMQKRPTPPDGVCNRIVSLAQNPRPPFRSYLGKDAFMTRVGQALFPRNFFVNMMGSIYIRALIKIGGKT